MLPYEGYEEPEPMGWGCITFTLILISGTLACLIGGGIALIQWIAQWIAS